MYKKNESSCLHERSDFLIHISVRIGLPTQYEHFYPCKRRERTQSVRNENVGWGGPE